MSEQPPDKDVSDEREGVLVGGCIHGAWLGDGCTICGAVARIIPPAKH